MFYSFIRFCKLSATYDKVSLWKLLILELKAFSIFKVKLETFLSYFSDVSFSWCKLIKFKIRVVSHVSKFLRTVHKVTCFNPSRTFKKKSLLQVFVLRNVKCLASLSNKSLYS